MNILLFSDIPPCSNYSAGIVLMQECEFLLEQGHQVNCFAVVDAQVKPEIPDRLKKSMKFKRVAKPQEDWGGGWRSRLMNGAMARRLPMITREAAEFAKETETELLWIVEQGQSIILQARPLAKATGLPYVMQTWDSPEWWLDTHHFDEATRAKVLKEYGEALAGAECFIAASKNMEQEFKERYHCKRAKAVRLGFPVEEPMQVERDEKRFIIALAGQVYATAEFTALVQALEKLDWHWGGKEIFLDLYVQSLPYMEGLKSPLDRHVRKKGWRVQRELLYELSKANLLYCPYWFDAEHALISHTSFPSKLCTYLSIARPVAVHAPVYASTYQFAKEQNAAYCLDTLDVDLLTEEIKAIIDDPNREQMGRNAYQAFRENLTLDHMRRDFLEAMGLPLDEQKVPKKAARPLRVLHLHNFDLMGNRFNGYEMLRACEDRPDVDMRQIALEKLGTNPRVIPLTRGDAMASARDVCDHLEISNSSRALIQPFASEIRKTCAWAEADVVHFHQMHNGMVSYFDIPALTAEKPSVMTVHDPWMLTGHCIHPLKCEKWKTGCVDCPHLDRAYSLQKDNSALMWQIRKRLLADVDMDLIVASDWMGSRVAASPITGHFKRVHRIPFGIDLHTFCPAEDQTALREKHGLPNDAFVMMFRQDHSAYKGMDYITDALEKLTPAERQRIVLLTVGSQGLLKDVAPTVRKLVELPWVTDNELMGELYQSCDVFLMPSTGESFGMMAIEAMASAKPVICLADTAVEEVSRAPELGIAVPEGDAEAMAAAMRRLMGSPEECRRRGEKSREYAEAEYDFDTYVERHLALYREIAERHRKEKGQ